MSTPGFEPRPPRMPLSSRCEDATTTLLQQLFLLDEDRFTSLLPPISRSSCPCCFIVVFWSHVLTKVVALFNIYRYFPSLFDYSAFPVRLYCSLKLLLQEHYSERSVVQLFRSSTSNFCCPEASYPFSGVDYPVLSLK